MVLSTVIPNLQQIVGTEAIEAAVDYSGSCDDAGTSGDDDSIKTGNNSNLTGASKENSQRMKHVFRKLCRILSAHMSTPLVIVLDDAQWADETSLELLEVLMNDQDNARLMCLACYRSEEVDSDHGVQQLRRRMKENPCSGSTITDIEIENLSVDHVNRVIMTLLSIDDGQETLVLAEICHRRTMGNIFFLLQFLIMLKEEQLLEFQLGLFKWKWDVETIESTTAATANVVGMVTERMQKLPSRCFLELAACLGSHFHVRTLTLAWSQVPVGPCDDDLSKRSDLESMLELAVQEQFIEHVEADSYRWLHDNIQEAALLSIADDRLPSLKVEIGMVLLNSLKEDELEMELFVVANLLTSLTPSNDAIGLATTNLFLRAAEKAISVSAFQSASKFAKKGIECLPSHAWETCFNQTLRLYSVATEACGYLGESEEMTRFSTAVLEQPKCSLFDRLRVYFVQIDYLGNNGKPFEAVDLALDVLNELGCPFPKRKAVRVVHAMRALQRFKKNPPTADTLRNLPMMTDIKKKEILKIIFRLETVFFYTKLMFLYTLTNATAVDLLLTYGKADYSGSAFFAVGNVLSAMSGDLKYLTTWSELAQLMVEVVPSKRQESRVCFATSAGLVWTRPLHSFPKGFVRGYQIGMKVGDTER